MKRKQVRLYDGGARHRELVAQLYARGWSSRGWMATLLSAVQNDEEWSCALEDDSLEEIKEARVVPDGWMFYSEVESGKTVLAFVEVEVTSPVSEDKMAAYANLFWELDVLEIALDVVVVDYAGEASHLLGQANMVERMFGGSRG